MRCLLALPLAILVSCGTANAGTYIIDNFSNLDTPNSGGGTSAAGDHGGAIVLPQLNAFCFPCARV